MRSELVKAIVPFDIAADGSFAIERSKLVGSDRWVFALADEGLGQTNEALLGFISVAGYRLASQPAKGISNQVARMASSLTLIDKLKLSNNLPLGECAPAAAGDEIATEYTRQQVATAFDFGLPDLDSIAEVDNAVKTIRNIWRNYDPASGELYEIQLTRNVNPGVRLAGIMNADSDPAAFAANSNVGIQFRTNRGLAEIRRLRAPDGSEKALGTSNDGTSGSDTFVTYFGGAPAGANGSLQAGIWRLLRPDGSIAAEADLALANPVSATGKPIGYIPSVRLVVDTGTGLVNSLTVRWYRVGQDGIPVLEENLALVAETVLGAYLQFDKISTTRGLDLADGRIDVADLRLQYSSASMDTISFKYSNLGCLFEMYFYR